MKMQPQSSGQTRFQWFRDDLRVEYRECAEASQVARETSNCLINRQKTKFFILRPKLEVPYSVLSFFRFPLIGLIKSGALIPKRNKPGKLRPITIPHQKDIIVMDAISMVLGSIFEDIFLNCSHGFRVKRERQIFFASVQSWGRGLSRNSSGLFRLRR